MDDGADTLLLAECMGFHFMPGECLADVVFVIPWSQLVCGCVLSLLDVWLILCLSFLALSLYVVVSCPCWMFGWSSLVIPCSQWVCGCVFTLLNVWLILCLSFLALRMYVVVFCPCWMSDWSSACHSLLLGCMWLYFVPAGCLADPLSFLALRMYVVVFYPYWISSWSSACPCFLSGCMCFCFVPA